MKVFNHLSSFFVKRKFRSRGKKTFIFGKVSVENPNVRIGDGCVFYPNVVFRGDGRISIGNRVKIGDNTILYASRNGGISIGDDTIIAANSFIIDCDHGTRKQSKISSQELTSFPVSIGQDVWIAEDVTILKGSSIPDGCVIGAKALVNTKLETSFGIYVGIPVHKIGTRSEK